MGATNLAGVFFAGNAPFHGADVFSGDFGVTVYHLPGTTGWVEFIGSTLTYADRPRRLWNPRILVDNPTFGVGPEGYGFTIAGSTNLPVVIEASPSLAGEPWTPLRSCTLTNGSLYFSDTDWAGYLRRFYRIRSP
jgi:hypothetical protein